MIKLSNTIGNLLQGLFVFVRVYIILKRHVFSDLGMDIDPSEQQAIPLPNVNASILKKVDFLRVC